jgi:hypothetical protein
LVAFTHAFPSLINAHVTCTQGFCDCLPLLAKSDRLSRDVHFISGLMAQRVPNLERSKKDLLIRL